MITGIIGQLQPSGTGVFNAKDCGQHGDSHPSVNMALLLHFELTEEEKKKNLTLRCHRSNSNGRLIATLFSTSISRSSQNLPGRESTTQFLSIIVFPIPRGQMLTPKVLFLALKVLNIDCPLSSTWRKLLSHTLMDVDASSPHTSPQTTSRQYMLSRCV